MGYGLRPNPTYEIAPTYAGNCALGVEREIATSSGVMSAGTLANSGVER